MFKVSNKYTRTKHIAFVSVIFIVELEQVFDHWKDNKQMCESYNTCSKF